MKKQFRLKKNQEISKIVNLRQVINSASFAIYYQPNNLEYTRVCVSVSKKLGIAVIRNKIKRQVREMVDKVFEFNHSKDYVIVVRKKYFDFSFQENLKILEISYKKIG